jgi:hypothetical protein
MGDKFNEMIDNILAAFSRLLDLPLTIILGGFIVFIIVLVFIVWFIRRKKQKTLGRWPVPVISLSVLLVLAFIADQKMNQLQSEVYTLKTKLQNKIWQGGSLSAENPEVNTDSLKKQLIPFLGELSIQGKRIHPSTEVYLIEATDPTLRIFISVTNLKDTTIQVKITPEYKEKYLTSDFAKQHNCFLAINGEAGSTPLPGCPLGQWTGNWISDGKAILLEDTDIRPFLSFDKKNKAVYYPENIVDKTNTAEKFNTLWGRYDILINGIILKREQGGKQPRTIMGVDATGDQLFLMVVDGRQPGYSMGIELPIAAAIIKTFGATNAMACDQGGSSCMYVSSMGGIVNSPSDGRERSTYSHFGLATK